MGAVVLPLIILNVKLYRLLRSTAYCQMSNSFFFLFVRQLDFLSDSQKETFSKQTNKQKRNHEFANAVVINNCRIYSSNFCY